MNKIYLFDVDGTLTPPRQKMASNFASFFDAFTLHHDVFLISGSNYAKLEEQVPENILEQCLGVYGCSGAEYYEKGVLQYTREHQFPNELMYLCQHFVRSSVFTMKTGNHIEMRPGMLNVSSVGRNADDNQRKAYHAWDVCTDERLEFVKQINESGLDYEASAGGEISVDIVPRGWNKSVVKEQILKKFPHASLIFFGDRIVKNGNDLPLAKALETPKGRHFSHPVSSYHDTWSFLQDELDRKDEDAA